MVLANLLNAFNTYIRVCVLNKFLFDFAEINNHQNDSSPAERRYASFRKERIE